MEKNFVTLILTKKKKKKPHGKYELLKEKNDTLDFIKIK